eukprot:4053822-Pyramimonas_sp.AAC.1
MTCWVPCGTFWRARGGSLEPLGAPRRRPLGPPVERPGAFLGPVLGRRNRSVSSGSPCVAPLRGRLGRLLGR